MSGLYRKICVKHKRLRECMHKVIPVYSVFQVTNLDLICEDLGQNLS